MRKYAYAWITLAFFLVSFGLHWFFGWKTFVDEATQHGQSPLVAEYLTQMSRDTFENWQSEFLQLLWQVVGLAYFLYVGSPSSKESGDRLEAKIDELLKQLPRGDELLAKIDARFLKSRGHTEPNS